MNLTNNFTLSEFEKSSYAKKHNIDNSVPDKYLLNVKRLALVLQRFRKYLGKPIYISSGYRSPQVNSGVGGASRSYHMFGRAADIYVQGYNSYSLAAAFRAFARKYGISYIECLPYRNAQLHISI